MATKWVIGCVVGMTLVCVSTAMAIAATRGDVSADVEAALLEQEWDTLTRICGPDERLKTSPVLRAIKGHACLLRNRNDESLLLFLSLGKEPDRRAWRDWARDFASQNERSAVAHYLRADALGRMGDWEGAKAAANEALSHDAKFAPALNAKGIAQGALGEFDDAWVSLQHACKLAPSFADARANLGAVLCRKRAIKGAMREYAEALRIWKDSRKETNAGEEFSLALNGLACCYFLRSENADGKDDWEQAKTVLRALTSTKGVGPVFLGNLNAIVNEEIQLAKEVAAKGGPGSAFDVQRQIGKLDRDIQHNRNVLKITPLGGPWTQALQDNTRANMREQIAQRDGLLRSIGQNPGGNPGGVKTKEIEDAFKRNIKGRKELPVATWFGLAQDLSL